MNSSDIVVGINEQSWSIRLGPIAEELMRRSPYPVMLVGREAH